MNKEDFIKIGEDTIHCDECAFCEDCEDRFTQCVANYQHEGKPVHLKACEYLQWNTMSDEAKAFFLQDVLPHEYKCKSLQRKKTTAMKYKLVSMTFYDKKEYTVYKVLCKKRWYLPWEGVTFDGNLHCWDKLHKWYDSKEDAINALKKVLKEEEVQENYPVIKEEEIEL